MRMLFRHPYFLWLLPLAIVPLLRAFVFRKSSPLAYSSVDAPARAGTGIRAFGYKSLSLIRAVAIALAILALARPQSGDEQSKVHVEGIAIQLVVDNSGSMSQEDFELEGKRMSRLEAVKKVIDGFIRGRKDDVIGLTSFSAYPSELCPLTLDYGILAKFLEWTKPDRIFGHTAIGDGLLSAAIQLRDAKAKSKVMVLLTDGINNYGANNPIDAAQVAAGFGIKIYTIGVAPDKPAPSGVDFFGRPVFPAGPEIDVNMLKEIAAIGGGKFFSAGDGEALRKIYSEIDRLEKSEQVTEKYLQYTELYHRPLTASLGLVFLEAFLGLTVLRKKP